MAVNWKIIPVEDFRIFTASDDIHAETNRIWRERNAENVRWLAEHPAPSPAMRITGSFIYAQPPNYRGLPLLHASPEEWRRRLAAVQSCGADTVIFQAAIWNELETCYYPSRHFAGYQCFDVLGMVLEAAESLGLRVFLGGYGSVTGWNMGRDSALVEREIAAHFACLDELFELYGGRFEGIYFAPETAFRGDRDRDGERSLNAIYRAFCRRLKDEAPGCRLLMCPGTKYYPGKLQEMEDSWSAMLDGVPLDILSPQDSIGCGGGTLWTLPYTYPVWKRLCDRLGIHFWSNIELFESLDCTQVDTAIPAEPRRVAAQIAAAEPYAEKLISWEMLHYPDAVAGPRGVALRQYLQKG